jgi:hypothetical protein
MFGVGVGVRVGGFTPVSSGGGFDPDAQAFFDRVTTAGGTLTTTEKNATNQLVLDMKSAGIWSSMKAVYPMVGASAAACAQNLKSSSFTGTFTSGWTFASSGVTPNGSSAYFDTTFNPFVSSNGVNDTSASVYLRTATQGSATQTDLGCFSTSNALPLFTINSNNASLRVNYCWDYLTNVGTTTTGDSRGMWGMSRSGASAWVSFDRNTSVSKTTTNTYSTLPNANVYLGAQNGNGTTIEFSPRQIAFAHMGNNLTATQFNNFYTAVQAFQTTLSRNV